MEARQANIRQGRRFTLLEVVIAVGIFMLVAVALFAYSRQTTNSWTRIMQERNTFSELLTLDRAVDQIFSHVVPFLWPDPNDELENEVPFIVANSESLRVAYIHRLNNEEEGALRFVEIMVKDGNLCATYSDRPFIYWENIGDRLWTSVLARDVESVTFRYADWGGDMTDAWSSRLKWVDEWETEDSGRTDVPLAIQMTVVWQNGKIESWLRRTMGNSYRERYGKWEPQEDDDD